MKVAKNKINGSKTNLNKQTTILVVEDDEGLNHLIQKTLQKEGYKTKSALTGTDAIAYVSDNQNIILLLDYLLPDMSGKLVIETLQQRKRPVPFIIMTGHGDEKIAVEMMKLDAKDYIVKDTGFTEILPQVIKRTVNELVQEKKLKAAKIALRKSEEKFRTLAENTKDIIYSTNAKGIITYISPQITRYGLSPEEIISKKIIDLVVEEDKNRVTHAYQNIISHGLEIPIEFGFKDQKGNFHWLEEHDKVQFDKNGKILGVNGILRDITERKHAENEIKKLNKDLEKRVKQRTAELEKTYKKLKTTREKIHEAQKRELIGLLASGIAKDFNQILTGLLDNINIIKASLKQKDKNFLLLTKSEHECVRAKDLTEQLFTYSKMGAPNKMFASIEELIKESTSFTGNGYNVKCEFSIPDNLYMMEIDKRQISQVMRNLITNATQAMPNGGIIEISAENSLIGRNNGKNINQLKNGKYVKISIKDNGIGIPTTHIQRIFEPYFTTKNKALGMGLAISNSIIKHHSGYITVDSVPGVGTTFSIYLPASQQESQPQTITDRTFQMGAELKKILVVDDEIGTEKLFNETFKQLGYESVFSKNGAEMIELYDNAKKTKNPFDAVIIDLPIPGGMGCKKAIQKLLEIDPEIKAIVSSVYSEDPIMTDHKKYGFKGYITKPYEINDLSRTLSEVINGINNPE